MMQSAVSRSHSQSFPQHRQHCFLSIRDRIRHFLPPKQVHSPSYHTILRCHYDFPTQPRKPISFPATDGHFLTPKRANGVRHFTHLLCGNSSNISSVNTKSQFRGFLESLSEALSTAFPVWVASGCLMGLWKPNSFNWVTPQLSIWGLTIIMLGMGMTLTFDDLQGAFAMPTEVLAGFCLQYSVAFFFIAGQVSRSLWIGFRSSIGLLADSFAAAHFPGIFPATVLIRLCISVLNAEFGDAIVRVPCEQAFMVAFTFCCLPNIGWLLSWCGNVALSVVMTAASTFSSVVMTPFLTAKLAGQYIAVDAAGLFKSTLQVVLLPVLVGAFLNQYFQGLVRLVSPLMPPLAVATVAILCGNAIAQSSSIILMSGRQVVLAVCLLHASGFFFGYALARLLGVDVSVARTTSIEIGMQNSVRGVVLANKHFGDPLTAVPCAVSSVCHSIIGSALAGIWRRSSPKEIAD